MDLDRFGVIVLPYLSGCSGYPELPDKLATYVRRGGRLLCGAGPYAPALKLLGIEVDNGDSPLVENRKQQQVAAALGLDDL